MDKIEETKQEKSIITIFKEFASSIEYPMVVFEAESGKVLDTNYKADILLGKGVANIKIEPGRAFTKLDFWNMLETKKSIIWHRIKMIADGKEHLVSGLISESVIDDKLIYTVLFELRADINIGSLTLERIVNHAGILAMHVSIDETGKQHVDYASQNINQYGYSRVQLYEKGMDISEMVCPDDYEYVYDDVHRAIDEKLEESSIECRLLTEEKDVVPVRLLFYYSYSDNGKLTDYEVIAIDRKEELKKSDENQYLSNAMYKMKSVLIVKSFHAGERSLKFISPNAIMLGMNVEALRNGYKLTEDYVHPEDRDTVVDSVYQAIANGVADYVHTFRMVRDDGKQIWVEGQVTINRISDGEAEVAFLLTDVSEQKDMEKELAAMVKASEQRVAASGSDEGANKKSIHIEKELTKKLQLLAESVGKHSEFYSVVLDENGLMITNPIGPQSDLGLFYDLFERPEVKRSISDMEEQVKLQLLPKSIDISLDGFPIRMIFSPLLVDDQVKAFWVLASVSGKGAAAMGEIIESQWQLANSVIQSHFAKDRVADEVKNRKLVEFKLNRERQERKVLQELLDLSIREGETALGEICQKIGLHLAVSNIGIYTENVETGNAEKYFTWSKVFDDNLFFDNVEFSVSEFEEIEKRLIKGKTVSAVLPETDDFLREILHKTHMKMITIETMVPGVGQRGYIIFGDPERSTAFDKSEQKFVEIASKLIQTIAFHDKNVVRMDVVREGFLETYDHIRDAIFVKNNVTGEIIFANKAMDKLFGYSVVGMQSQDIINDQMEQYRLLSGMRKRFIANNKVTKWQSYLKELDQILNVVEVRLNIFSGTDLSLVILKKNKNK